MRITEQGVKRLEIRISDLKPKISKELEAEINRAFLDLAEYLFKEIQCGRKSIHNTSHELQGDYVYMLRVYMKEGSNRLMAEEMGIYLGSHALWATCTPATP